MKRRSFLGFLGGAAAAGPKLAADLAATRVGSSIGGSIGREPECSPVSGDGSWKLTKISRLKQLLAEGDPKAKESRRIDRLYSLEQQERYRLDALRSVAPHHKFSMLMDGGEARQDRINRASWSLELTKLLEM